MVEIKNATDLKEFFGQEQAVLFFHADWSRYAVISKYMIEHVEYCARISGREYSHVAFYYLADVEDRRPIADALVATAGLSALVFKGDGTASFFRNGKHMHTMQSVIGEGTWAVWHQIEALFK